MRPKVNVWLTLMGKKTEVKEIGVNDLIFKPAFPTVSHEYTD